ncbi:hypothetical protein GCM10009809_42110 [Isoptericola hypogeus]|uniref:Uncharacterized protein n=1 Tax=Isoptericola hypogeus TaxID=300179 RepID=A0ABP4W0E0_9MICO
MSVADDISAKVAQWAADAREQFRGRMRGTLSITRPDPSHPLENPATGEVTFAGPEVYNGPGYLRYPGLAQETSPIAGGSTQFDSRIVVRVPFGVAFRPGDQVEVLVDPDNPQLVGTRVWVASIDDQSQATAQRLLCVDHQGGVQ